MGMLQKKKTKVVFASLAGILLVLVFFLIFIEPRKHYPQNYFFNVLLCTFFDKNNIIVDGENIDINKVTIELMDYPHGIVFKNGKKVKRIKNEYGDNDFKVFYDSLLIAQAGIFKYNWYHTHDYFFYVVKNDSTFDFSFSVKGPDSETLYYKIFTMDKLNKKSTEVFYNDSGKDGQININYYDNKGNIIVDECWINDTLVNLNLYKEGNWYKHYTTNKFSKTAGYKLIKLHPDSLKYIYQTIENEEVEEEIKNSKSTNQQINKLTTK